MDDITQSEKNNAEDLKAFLQCFPGYHIQTLDDKNAKGAIPWRKQINALIKSAPPKEFTGPELADLNIKGAGIFFSPNNFPQQRKAELCAGVNAWSMEIDGVEKDEQWSRILKAPLDPSVIVESRNSLHCHWLAVDGTIENFGRIVKGLIQFFGSDPACKDISRVYRIPGFSHNKKDPFLVTIRFANYSAKYTDAQMMEAFPYSEKEYKAVTRQSEPITEGLGFWEAAGRLDNKTILTRLSGTTIGNFETISFRPRPIGGEYIDVNGEPADAWLDEQGMIGSGKGGGPTYIQWLEYYGWSKRDIAKWIKETCADLLPMSALGVDRKSLNKPIAPDRVPDLRPIPLSELMDKKFNEPQWLVEKLLPTAGIIALSGSPASYKTWIVLDLVLRIAKGEILFGKFATTQGGVLIVDEENGERLLQHRLRKLESIFELPIYILSLKGFNLTIETLKKLITFSTANDVKLVVFDSLVRIHNSDENSAREMAQVFKLLKDFTKEGITVLFTHHHRKQGIIKVGPSQDMRGSTDILASLDCHLAVDKKDDCVIMTQSKLRQEQEIQPFKLNVIGDENSLKFEYAGEIEEAQNKKDKFAEAIRDLLGREGKPMYKKKIFDTLKTAGLKGEYKTFMSSVKEMVENGELFEQKGEKNKTFCSLKPFEEDQIDMAKEVFESVKI